MKKNTSIIYFIVFLLLYSFCPLNGSSEDTERWWNTKWSYRQGIIIPPEINLSLNAFQPIDIFMRFEYPCWAKNETIYSIRVIKQNQKEYQELESQIYNLEFDKDRILLACKLVFLIPDHMTSNDHFYVYYDESSTSQSYYTDHISIIDSLYYYEPMPGYPLFSQFYHIIEDGSSVYAISQEGKFMDFYTAQSITKLTANTTIVQPENGQAIASFDYSFFYGDTMQDSYTTSKSLISKQINTDGNLLVSCTIKSTSSTNDMFSTVTYNYYYCPTPEKKIFCSVCHEITNAYTTAKNVLTDGIYATLLTASVKSVAIEKLNFGIIKPYIHYINENKEFKEYTVDPNPSYISTGECLPIISIKHDQDLSDNPWICFDDGETGEAFAFLFNTTHVIESGENERDGVQIKAYEIDSPHLPGFENNMAVILLGRNSYEKQEDLDIYTPKDFVIRFNAEFFYTPTGGYPKVMKEAASYQSLSLLRYQNNNSQEITNIREKAYNLTVFVRNALTFPQAQALSLVSGLNLSFIQVEIYQNNTMICTGSPSKIHFKNISVMMDSDIPLIPKISKFWDWKETTFFKSIKFRNLAAGIYIVKIVRYHPLIHKNPQYIGVEIVSIEDDTEIFVKCTKQKQVVIKVTDQNLHPVKNVLAYISLDNYCISSNITNQFGNTILSFPSHLVQPYQLIVIYKGFLISNETIVYSNLFRMKPLEKEIQLEQYNLDLIFRDSWNLPYAINIYPQLTSHQQQVPFSFLFNQTASGQYSFDDLPKAMYVLKHPSTSQDILMNLDSNQTNTIILPDTYQVSYHLFNKRGIPVNHLRIIANRENKTSSYNADIQNGSIFLPAGSYLLDVFQKNNIVCSLNIRVYSDISVEIVTIIEPMENSIIMIVLLIILVFSIIGSIKQKTYLFLLIGIIICLLIYYILNPCWMITGETNDMHMKSSLYLAPPNLVTFYSNQTIQTGELAGLPSIINIASFCFIIMLIIGCLSLMLWQCFQKYISLSQSKEFIYLILSTLIICIGFIGLTIIMYILSNVTIGSFFGNGLLDVMIPSDINDYAIKCIWGPTYGWYGGIAVCLLSWIMVFNQRKSIKNSNND